MKGTERVSDRTMRRRGLLLGLLLLPLYAMVDHYRGPGEAGAAMGFAGILGMILMAFWDLRRKPWYWMAIAAIIVSHVALIVTVTWPTRSFPAPELWPIGMADFFAMYGFIKLTEKAMAPRGDPGPSLEDKHGGRS